MAAIAKEHLPGRIELPVNEEEHERIEAFREDTSWYYRTKNGMLRALLLKKPLFTGKAKAKPRPTKHQRHMARVKARREWLRHMRALDEYAENTTHGNTWIEDEVF